mmetsp:Transcript_23143/g.46909  ORF Transcript_23143/g.46909 Transcript_23143/m.46909 type:complete len:298 (+) Transcript_23143:883-1776(+)
MGASVFHRKVAASRRMTLRPSFPWPPHTYMERPTTAPTWPNRPVCTGYSPSMSVSASHLPLRMSKHSELLTVPEKVCWTAPPSTNSFSSFTASQASLAPVEASIAADHPACPAVAKMHLASRGVARMFSAQAVAGGAPQVRPRMGGTAMPFSSRQLTRILKLDLKIAKSARRVLCSAINCCSGERFVFACGDPLLLCGVSPPFLLCGLSSLALGLCGLALGLCGTLSDWMSSPPAAGGAVCALSLWRSMPPAPGGSPSPFTRSGTDIQASATEAMAPLEKTSTTAPANKNCERKRCP